MYSQQKAVEYAYFWWNKRNPQFYNFESLGGDCTNFVSQCLYFGGIEMNYNTLGWFYDGLDFRSPSWTGVEEFYNFATKNQSTRGVRAKVVDISQIGVGDVVQLSQNDGNFHHTLLVTKILGQNSTDNILVTCHTFDAKDKALSSYYYKKIRYLKILN